MDFGICYAELEMDVVSRIGSVFMKKAFKFGMVK